ncbi:MAG: hypothetical protein AAB702_01950 [Patescibacteria group bacterium]
MAVALSELGRREQPKSLTSTLETGQRIALGSSIDNVSARPVFIHDPRGLIKEGNPRVVVWTAPRNR